ncbi:MAG: hypothetical protein DHS20C02_09950 [Micavibrio sp.]|nr:MAG: hypothetical protein DHS20C02_09950 [Micavibrio sp.]
MMYTTMGHKQKNMNLRSIEYKNKDLKKSEDTEEQGTPSEQVWKRYKSLAAGEQEKEQNPPKEIEAASETKPAQVEQPKLTGLAGLIQQYQKNKENRGGMKSINVSGPKASQEKSLKEKESSFQNQGSAP